MGRLGSKCFSSLFTEKELKLSLACTKQSFQTRLRHFEHPCKTFFVTEVFLCFLFFLVPKLLSVSLFCYMPQKARGEWGLSHETGRHSSTLESALSHRKQWKSAWRFRRGEKKPILWWCAVAMNIEEIAIISADMCPLPQGKKSLLV